MARRHYSFHRLAARELEHERRFYQRKAKLGTALVEAVKKACLHMAERPVQFAPVATVRGVVVRSIRVKRFPFRVYFGDFGHELRVYAIAHVRRRPSYWTRRVGG